MARHQQLFTTEKALYFSEKNAGGLHVAHTERRDTTLSGIIRGLTAQGMLVASNFEENVGRHYTLTSLGKLFLKCHQAVYEKNKHGETKGRGRELAKMLQHDFTQEQLLTMKEILILAKAQDLSTDDYRHSECSIKRSAMTTLNKLTCIDKFNRKVFGLTAIGNALLDANLTLQ